MKYQDVLGNSFGISALQQMLNEKGESRITDIDLAVDLGIFLNGVNKAMDAYTVVERGVKRTFRSKLDAISEIKDQIEKEIKYRGIMQDMEDKLVESKEKEIKEGIVIEIPTLTKEQLKELKVQPQAIANFIALGMYVPEKKTKK